MAALKLMTAMLVLLSACQPVAKPPGADTAATHQGLVRVGMTAGGEILWNGEAVSRDELERRVREVVTKDPTTGFVLEQERRVPSGLFGGVIQTLEEAGAKNVGAIGGR